MKLAIAGTAAPSGAGEQRAEVGTVRIRALDKGPSGLTLGPLKTGRASAEQASLTPLGRELDISKGRLSGTCWCP